MNVTVLTSRFPYPPDRGDRLTILNLLRALSARHRVTLISFVDGGEPAEGHAEVSRYCARIETVRLPALRSWAQAWLGLFSDLPSQVSYYRSTRMRDLVSRVVEETAPDVVCNHTIRMAPFVLDLPHPAKVLWLGDSLGMALGRSMPFEPWWKRPGIAWERRRVDRFEARISPRFRETWALSPADRDDLVRIGCRDVVVVTHGVDERLFDVERRPGQSPRVVFLGNLSVPHNRDAARFAARDIWPGVKAGYPEARLVLAGADPGPEVRSLSDVDGVEVLGPVADLRSLWTSADVLLAPLRFSTGIQNKVLEAMAAGVPVVTTPQVAEGIEARPEEHLSVAENAPALATAVLEALRDRAGSAARAERARAYVRRHFSWDTAVRRLEHVAAQSSAARATA